MHRHIQKSNQQEADMGLAEASRVLTKPGYFKPKKIF